MKTEKIRKIETRLNSDVSGIFAALLCSLVAWSWATLLIAEGYFMMFCWDLIEWYHEMKREQVKAHFKNLRQNAD